MYAGEFSGKHLFGSGFFVKLKNSSGGRCKMPKMKIKLSLNLENIRCFLYGYGMNDEGDEKEIYEKPALREPVSGCNPDEIKKRIDFIKIHFGMNFFNCLTEKYLSKMGKKEKNDYIRELCERKENRMGTAGFIKDVREMCIEKKGWVTLSKLVEINKGILCQWHLNCFDKEISFFIMRILEVEQNKSEQIAETGNKNNQRDTVCYVLQMIHHKALINESINSSVESKAKVLSLLILAALLREEFPVSLLKESSRKYDLEQQYHVENIFTCIQCNLGILNVQLFSQESFLEKIMSSFSLDKNIKDKEYDSIKKKRDFDSIKTYYLLQLFQNEKAWYMTDYTNVGEICEKQQLLIDQKTAEFLHDAVFYMKEFAEKGMEQILKYAAIAWEQKTTSYGEVKLLADKYKVCIELYRNLVYWNLVILCHGQQYDTIKDMEELSELIYPKRVFPLFVSIEMNQKDIKDNEIFAERKFCQAMNQVKCNNMAVTFPETFYELGFIKKMKMSPYIEKFPIRKICGSVQKNREYVIIDAFCAEFECLDKIFKIHENILNDLPVIANTEKDILNRKIEQIKLDINNYKSKMQNILKIPHAIIKDPLALYMQEKDMKTAEFQSFCCYVYICVMENLRYMDMIEETCFAMIEKNNDFIRFCRDYEIYCNDAKKTFSMEITYLNEVPNYWFAGWSKDALDYLKHKCENLSILSINWETWVNTKAEAELKLAYVLDYMENDIIKTGRAVAEAEQTLFELEMEVEKLMEELDQPLNES